MDKERPGYYAVIPADVRYDDRIPANAKLLYGEISALIGRDGYCFAGNQYFADIYGCTPVTIARLISQLEKAGHIKRELEKDNSGQVVRRKIWLSVSIVDAQPLNNFDNTPLQNCGEGINKNVKDTNTSNTNIDIKEKYKKEKSEKKKDTPPRTDFDPLPQFVDWIGKTFPDREPAVKNELYRAFGRFVKNRVALKKPYKTSGAATGLCNKLVKYAMADIGLMIELLDNATEHSWQTVFPLNGEPAQKPQQNEREYKCV